MTSATTRHTVWICSKTMTIATTKYAVDLWCECIQVSNIHNSNRSPRRDDDNVVSWYPRVFDVIEPGTSRPMWISEFEVKHERNRLSSDQCWKPLTTTRKTINDKKWFPRYHKSDKFLDFVPGWCVEVDRKKSVEGRPWCILHQSTRKKGRWCNDQSWTDTGGLVRRTR